MNRSAWTPLAVVLVAAGCRAAPHPMEPLAIPPAATIEHIGVQRLRPGGEPQHEIKIWDRPAIEAILAELRRNNAGYASEMDGRAPQEYAIALNGYASLEAMIWIGHGWLGGVDKQHTDPQGGLAGRYRRLAPDQHARLVTLVKGPAQ